MNVTFPVERLQPIFSAENLRKIKFIYVFNFAHQSLRNIVLTLVSCEFQKFVVPSMHRCNKPGVLTK
jgi:hypothetical protein